MNFCEICSDRGKEYLSNIPVAEKHGKGQIFTPSSIARFMASQYEIDPGRKEYTVLDPGSGAGILTAAFCEYIFSNTKANITAVLYEVDQNLLPLLRKNMSLISETFRRSKRTFSFEIRQNDFIEDNYNALENNIRPKFDFIISNPPYYKLRKQSHQVQLLNKIIHGQPNIYFLFMAIASKLLKEDGQLTFITPRSFCSGQYFKLFREWFISNISINKIHLFDSRSETFLNEILQETIILSASRRKNTFIKVTSSTNSTFMDLKKINVPRNLIISSNEESQIIKIPTCNEEVKVLEEMIHLKYTLPDLGLRVSTGPVVDFRSREHLKTTYKSGNGHIPLLWMHNIDDFFVKWDKDERKKPQSILINRETHKLLRPTSNYVFIKRFSSKEQKKRLCAGAFLKGSIDKKYIGIENHLNYVWDPLKELAVPLVYGLTAIFNSTLYDRYFRIINGNTQVNASDLNIMRFPDLITISKIGKQVEKANEITSDLIDRLVEKNLETTLK